MEIIGVSGLKELNRKLLRLPDRIERNIMSSAVRAGANVIKKLALRNLALSTRSFSFDPKKDIIVRKSRAPKGTTMFKVGPPRRKFYLAFKEHGTDPHPISIKDKKMLYDGSVFRGKSVWHPGQKREPFLRPALDEGARAAVEAMAQRIRQRLEKEAAK